MEIQLNEKLGGNIPREEQDDAIIRQNWETLPDWLRESLLLTGFDPKGERK